MAEIDDLINDEEDKTSSKDEVINRKNKRLIDLSNKVELTAKERDEKDRLLKEKDAELASAQKERDFFASFSEVTAKYPGSNEFKDEIKSKVLAGYSVEDAAISVLARNNKLQGAPVTPTSTPAGGSAIVPPTQGEKKVSDMTQAERRAALVELEARGDISIN